VWTNGIYNEGQADPIDWLVAEVIGRLCEWQLLVDRLVSAGNHRIAPYSV